MVSYFPIVTGSLTVLGNISVSGSITTSGSITISGSITSASFASTASYWSGSIVNAESASFASTASFVANAQTASYVLNAVSSSFATSASYWSGSIVNAESASFASTASFVALAQSASYVLNAVSSSFASTASFVALAQSASNAVSAVTASFANNLTVAGTLTAQTLVVQTITSSVDFVTGSTRFGSILANMHVFTGSMSVSGSITSQGGFILGNSHTISPTGSIGYNNAIGVYIYGKSGSEADFRLYNASGLTAMSVVAGTQNISFNSSVAIGTTNLSARLNVQASANFENATLGTATGTMGYLSANGLYGMYVGIGNSGNTWLQSQRNDGTTAVYNLLLNPQGGNVGIGTSSPSTTLHALGPIRSQDSRGGSLPAVEISGGNVSLFPYISVDQSNPMSFITAGQYRMLITGTTGNVLIGTTTDSGYKLDISGTTRVNGSLLTNTIRTTEGSTTANSGAYATLFTISGSKAVFQIFVQVPAGAGDAANYTVYAVVLYDGSAARIIANNGGVTDIILSGLNVQARQQSGNPQTIEWKYLRIQ